MNAGLAASARPLISGSPRRKLIRFEISSQLLQGMIRAGNKHYWVAVGR